MSTQLPTDTEAFLHFLTEQVGNGGADKSPEELLQLWRTQHPSPQEIEESVAAIKRAVDQADRGEGKTLEEFDRDFRNKHSIPE